MSYSRNWTWLPQWNRDWNPTGYRCEYLPGGGSSSKGIETVHHFRPVGFATEGMAKWSQAVSMRKTTAAGDTFNGALMTSLLEDKPLLISVLLMLPQQLASPEGVQPSPDLTRNPTFTITLKSGETYPYFFTVSMTQQHSLHDKRTTMATYERHR